MVPWNTFFFFREKSFNKYSIACYSYYKNARGSITDTPNSNLLNSFICFNPVILVVLVVAIIPVIIGSSWSMTDKMKTRSTTSSTTTTTMPTTTSTIPQNGGG